MKCIYYLVYYRVQDVYDAVVKSPHFLVIFLLILSSFSYFSVIAQASDFLGEFYACSSPMYFRKKFSTSQVI